MHWRLYLLSFRAIVSIYLDPLLVPFPFPLQYWGRSVAHLAFLTSLRGFDFLSPTVWRDHRLQRFTLGYPAFFKHPRFVPQVRIFTTSIGRMSQFLHPATDAFSGFVKTLSQIWEAVGSCRGPVRVFVSHQWEHFAWSTDRRRASHNQTCTCRCLEQFVGLSTYYGPQSAVRAARWMLAYTSHQSLWDQGPSRPSRRTCVWVRPQSACQRACRLSCWAGWIARYLSMLFFALTPWRSSSNRRWHFWGALRE